LDWDKWDLDVLHKPATAVTMARLPHAIGFNLVFFMSVTGPTKSSLWTSAPIAQKTPDASPEPHSHGYTKTSISVWQSQYQAISFPCCQTRQAVASRSYIFEAHLFNNTCNPRKHDSTEAQQWLVKSGHCQIWLWASLGLDMTS
jgi:hypothetical protein